MHCSRRLIVQTLVFSCSYLHRLVSPPEALVVKGGTTWARNGRWILPENARLPCNIQGSFTCCKSTTWDKRLYFPSEGKCAEDFFALKNPMASAGFEPANLGTKGQHATSRPPKPLGTKVNAYLHLSTAAIKHVWILPCLTHMVWWFIKHRHNLQVFMFSQWSCETWHSVTSSHGIVLFITSQYGVALVPANMAQCVLPGNMM